MRITEFCLLECWAGRRLMCQDSQPKTLPAFGNIADGAQAVLNNCPWQVVPYAFLVSGQDFHDDN
jgi:hypothetical protein